jgi:myosin heavy subunit
MKTERNNIVRSSSTNAIPKKLKNGITKKTFIPTLQPQVNHTLLNQSQQLPSITFQRQYPFGTTRRFQTNRIASLYGYGNRNHFNNTYIVNRVMIERIVYNGIRHIRNTSPYNTKSWTLLANELSHRGYMKQSFRCSVIANHINQYGPTPEEKLLMLQNKKKMKSGAKRNNQVHHHHYYLSGDNSTVPDKQRKQQIENEKKLMNAKVITEVPVREKRIQRPKELPTVESIVAEISSNQKDLKRTTAKQEEKSTSSQSPKLKQLRKQYWDICNNMEQIESQLLTVQQEIDSIKREIKQVREKWVESLQSTVEHLKENVTGKEHQSSSDVSSEKQQAWKQRYDYLSNQQQKLQKRVDDLFEEKRKISSQRDTMKTSLLEEENKQQPVQKKIRSIKSATDLTVSSDSVQDQNRSTTTSNTTASNKSTPQKSTVGQSFLFNRGRL